MSAAPAIMSNGSTWTIISNFEKSLYPEAKTEAYAA